MNEFEKYLIGLSTKERTEIVNKIVNDLLILSKVCKKYHTYLSNISDRKIRLKEIERLTYEFRTSKK